MYAKLGGLWHHMICVCVCVCACVCVVAVYYDIMVVLAYVFMNDILLIVKFGVVTICL